ncbi:unnamed protein product, partial [Pelagomonas calceolata]
MPRWCPTLKPRVFSATETRFMLRSEQGAGRPGPRACRRHGARRLIMFRRPPRTTSGRRRRRRRRDTARPRRPRRPRSWSATAAVVVVARPLRRSSAAARRRPPARGRGECLSLAALLSARRGARFGPSAWCEVIAALRTWFCANNYSRNAATASALVVFAPLAL